MIILTPLTEVPGGDVPCSSLIVVHPNVPIHEGCPVLTKTRSITVSKGQEATVEWVLTNRDGEVVDVTSCLFDDDLQVGEIRIRIKDALSTRKYYVEIEEVTIIDAEEGIIQFDLPAEIVDKSCLYEFEIAVINSAGRIVFTNKGLLSVEPGLFGDTASIDDGVLTLEEIRMQLRDILAENDLNEDVEFDDADILHSIKQPIRFWNEIPPDVARFDACNFPYHNAWLKGTCANLLRIAATWYERNNLQSAHGGVQLNDRAKTNGYLVLSKQYEQEWREFVERKKIEINTLDCYGCA